MTVWASIWLLISSAALLLVATTFAVSGDDAFGAALGGFTLAILLSRIVHQIHRYRR